MIWVSPGYKCALGVDVMHTQSDNCHGHPALRDFAQHLIVTHDETLPTPQKYELGTSHHMI